MVAWGDHQPDGVFSIGAVLVGSTAAANLQPWRPAPAGEGGPMVRPRHGALGVNVPPSPPPHAAAGVPAASERGVQPAGCIIFKLSRPDEGGIVTLYINVQKDNESPNVHPARECAVGLHKVRPFCVPSVARRPDVSRSRDV